MITLAIDPGVRGCGAALFENEVLCAATYVKNPATGGKRLDSAVRMAEAVARFRSLYFPTEPPLHLVIEVPRSYDAGHQKGPQDDLIDVALVAAAVAGHIQSYCGAVTTYYPQEWKGTVKAETFLARILERLTPSEAGRIHLVGRTPLHKVPDSDSLDHNTLDAIGIGLKFLGRGERTRVFARD